MADPSASGPTRSRVSWITRILAPLALLAALLALYLIVTSADVGGGDTTTQQSASGGSETDAGKPKKDKEGPENPRTYVVEEGDSLSTIAEQFGVSVDRLVRLNPDVDPQALTTGQEITIR
jgi:LysM repeat protein